MKYKSILITIFAIISIIPAGADSRTFLSIIKDNQAVISILVDNSTKVYFKDKSINVCSASKEFEIQKDEVTSFRYTSKPVSSISSLVKDEEIIITNYGVVIEHPMKFPLYIFSMGGIEIKRYCQRENLTVLFSELPDEPLVIIYGNQSFKVKRNQK